MKAYQASIGILFKYRLVLSLNIEVKQVYI